MAQHDLDGFPILRLDEIPSLDSKLLKHAEPAAKELLDSLRDQTDSQKLVSYLQRQIEIIKKELARRAANERVQALLLGAEDIFNHSYNDINNSSNKSNSFTTLDEYMKDNNTYVRQITSAPIQSTNSNMTPHISEIRTLTGQDTRQSNNNITFQPLPLPSELAAKSEQSSIPSRRKSNINENFTTKTNNWVGQENIKDDDNNDNSDTNSEDMKTLKKRRSEKFEAKPKIVEFNGMPSKASIAVLHENFGSKFIVAATEKKKRIMPKKPSETLCIEAQKEKERLERRKQSMQRLMERREKRQALEYKAKIIKQKKKMETKALSKANSNKSMNSTIVDSESSEESISGGEEEIVIDQKLVDNVEKAIGTVEEIKDDAIEVENEKNENHFMENEYNNGEISSVIAAEIAAVMESANKLSYYKNDITEADTNMTDTNMSNLIGGNKHSINNQLIPKKGENMDANFRIYNDDCDDDDDNDDDYKARLNQFYNSSQDNEKIQKASRNNSLSKILKPSTGLHKVVRNDSTPKLKAPVHQPIRTTTKSLNNENTISKGSFHSTRKPPPPDQKAKALATAVKKFFAELSNINEISDDFDNQIEQAIPVEISDEFKNNDATITKSDLQDMVANLVAINSKTLMTTEKMIVSVADVVSKIANANSPRLENSHQLNMTIDVAEKNSAALSVIRKMKSEKNKKSSSDNSNNDTDQSIIDDPWTEVIDGGSGQSYWWNKETNETSAIGASKPICPSSEIPRLEETQIENILSATDPWTEVIDDESGQSYWWNTETNETTPLGADKPTEVSPKKEKKKKGKKNRDNVLSTLEETVTTEAEPPTSDVSEQPNNEIQLTTNSDDTNTASTDPWTEVIDDESGQSYWWNTETNETTPLGADKPTEVSPKKKKKKKGKKNRDNVLSTLEETVTTEAEPPTSDVSEQPNNEIQLTTNSDDTNTASTDPWTEVIDDESGQSYWWNTETDETTPLGADKPTEKFYKKGSTNTNSNVHDDDKSSLKESQPTDTVTDPWIEVVDEDGHTYWWNTHTDETTEVGEDKPSSRGRKNEGRKNRKGGERRRSRSGERKPSNPMATDPGRRVVSAGLRRPSFESTDPAPPQISVSVNSIISLKDNVYRCSLGPDELPGLRAWTLTSTDVQDPKDVQWAVDISTYFDTLKSDPMVVQLNERRQLARRSVSYGLIKLVKDCENLLLGKEVVSHSNQFIALWEKRLQDFDEKVFELSEAEEKELFRTVTVCGNCHAVCRKVEHLLKCKFTIGNSICSATPRSSFRKTISSPASVPNSEAVGKDGFRFRLGSTDTDEVNSDDNDDEDGLLPTYLQVSDDISTKSVALSPKLVKKVSDLNLEHMDQTSSVAPPVSARALLRTPPLEAKQRWLEEKKLGEIDKLRDQLQKDGIHLQQFLQPSQQLEDKRSDSAVTIEKNRNRSIDVHPDPASVQLSKARMGRVIEDQIDTLELVPLKLNEMYPHIGAIFPAVGGAAPSATTARTLIECMEAQSKLYEEWIEIMSDYATVFSHERGVRETFEENGTSGASSSVYNGGTRSLHYRVKSPRPEVYNIVTDVLNNFLNGWEELPAGLGLGVSWNLLWTWSKPRLNMAHLLSWQKVNHFQDSKQLTRKDLLKKNLQRFTDMTGKIAEAFEIMPQTFLLPHEYTQFVKCFTEIENKREELGVQNYWIMKPVGMSRGRGITLVRDVVSLTYSQTSVVQMYIERPLTLGGYKFDLRLFVCVTSFKPLEAFVYKEGFARVSTHTYSTDPSQMGNKFIHLTNSSIQKQNTAGPTKDNPLMDSEGPGGGSKIPLHGHNGLWERLENSGINVEVLWRNICLVILKSLVVVDEKIANQPCGFELFGYDVLIDEQLRPWLIEVNASPSLARENQLDIRIKNSMIKDTISLVEPAPYDRAAVARILKRRLHDISKNRFASSKNDPDLENDLKEIFGDYTPRRIGENPKNMGDYQRLAPNTKIYTHIMRLKGKIIKN